MIVLCRGLPGAILELHTEEEFDGMHLSQGGQKDDVQHLRLDFKN